MKNYAIVEQVSPEVTAILLSMTGVSKEKAGKILVKSFAADKRLNAFLNAKFDSGLKALTNAQTREKVFASVEDHGITAENEKRAAVIHALRADVDQQVNEKIAQITLDGKLAMNEEQTAKFQKKIVAYRAFLLKDLAAGLKDFGMYLGVVEEVKEPVKKAEEVVAE